jgi:hypothetical protein
MDSLPFSNLKFSSTNKRMENKTLLNYQEMYQILYTLSSSLQTPSRKTLTLTKNIEPENPKPDDDTS